MKYILFVSLVLSGCKTKMYNYNICDFTKFQGTEAIEDFAVKIDEFHYNSLDSHEYKLYGFFKGENRYNNRKYNFIILNTKNSPQQLIESNISGEVAIKIYKKVECFNFTTTFKIEDYFDKSIPVIIGEFMLIEEH